MTEKPKETPKEELECPKKYVYDTGIIFECKDNIRVEIIGEDVVDLLNELDGKWIDEFSLRETLQLELQRVEKENEQLKKQIERIDFILDDLNGAEYISRDDGIKALNKIDKVIGKR